MQNVYIVQETGEGNDKKAFWNKCGVAFENRDGSLSMKLDLFQGVNFQIRAAKSDAAEQPPQQQQPQNGGKRNGR